MSRIPRRLRPKYFRRNWWQDDRNRHFWGTLVGCPNLAAHFTWRMA